MTNNKVGLHLRDRQGEWAALESTQPGDKLYFFGTGRDDLEVQFRPGHGTVTHFPEPFSHLVHHLKKEAPDGLDYVRVPRTLGSCGWELHQLRQAGLVTDQTQIIEGFLS